ncbi:MAG: type II toxin-antitoxin system HicB family antitoxin [Candidatus Omnitrophota bacterium]
MVPALDGCFTEGETDEEALQNAKEAITCYLEGLEKLNSVCIKDKIPDLKDAVQDPDFLEDLKAINHDFETVDLEGWE